MLNSNSSSCGDEKQRVYIETFDHHILLNNIYSFIFTYCHRKFVAFRLEIGLGSKDYYIFTERKWYFVYSTLSQQGKIFSWINAKFTADKNVCTLELLKKN